MVNTKLLRDEIKESGLSNETIASKLGLSLQGFINKRDGKTDFKTEEVMTLCDILRISSLRKKEKIFFARK